MLSSKIITIQDVSADRRCRGLLGIVDPAWEMFLNPRCHSSLSASDVTASTVTAKVVDHRSAFRKILCTDCLCLGGFLFSPFVLSCHFLAGSKRTSSLCHCHRSCDFVIPAVYTWCEATKALVWFYFLQYMNLTTSSLFKLIGHKNCFK